MEKKTASRGPGLFLLLILAGIAIYYFLSSRQGAITPNYTNETLENSIKLGSVVMVEIYQNSEVPTGTVYVLFTDRSDIRYYTADVKETQKILDKNKIEYSLYDVARPGWIEKLLPCLRRSCLSCCCRCCLAEYQEEAVIPRS